MMQGAEIAGVGAAIWNVIAIVTVISAVFVASSKNIVYSAFALLLTLTGVAGLYAFLGADFLAATQILLYVGGILILILFAVMLTSRIGDIEITNVSIGGGKGLAVLALLLVIFHLFLVERTEWRELDVKSFKPTTELLGEAIIGKYLLPFEIASVLLLAALIGAVVIARKEVKKGLD